MTRHVAFACQHSPGCFSLSIRYFFFNDTATTEIYTLSLHDALPIFLARRGGNPELYPEHLLLALLDQEDRKSTRLNSSHLVISYAVFCLKNKTHVFEQPSAASEQDRDDRDDDLVEQTRCEVLLRDGRPAPERHLLLSGCCPRLFERRLDPVRDEVERRSALHLQRLARMSSEDEDGMVEGRIVSPPALP